MELKNKRREQQTKTKGLVQRVTEEGQNKLAAMQSMRVTNGGFGRTLEKFMKKRRMPASTVRLLKRSRDFRKLATALDKEYEDYENTTKYNPEFNSKNRIIKGAKGMPKNYIGKLELMFSEDNAGANFMSADSPDNQTIRDTISIRYLSKTRFIQELVHESCHAYNHASSSGPIPKDLIASIRADTQEEIKVRKREQKILSEINKGLKTKLKFNAVGSTVPAIVGRDFSPGLGLTYLENSFFAFRLRVLQAQEKLSDSQAEKMRKMLKNKPVSGLALLPYRDPKSGLYELSAYGETWRDRLKAKKSWKQFYLSDEKNSSRARELRIQQHAKSYFKGLVRYSRLP